MPVRDFRPSAHEEWSQHDQTLRHAGDKRPGDDHALLHNPYDYSGVGGPDGGRTPPVGRNGAHVLSAAATFGSLVDSLFGPAENVTPCERRQLAYAVN